MKVEEGLLEGEDKVMAGQSDQLIINLHGGRTILWMQLFKIKESCI